MLAAGERGAVILKVRMAIAQPGPAEPEIGTLP